MPKSVKELNSADTSNGLTNSEKAAEALKLVENRIKVGHTFFFLDIFRNQISWFRMWRMKVFPQIHPTWTLRVVCE